jgi:hypothetical protein
LLRSKSTDNLQTPDRKQHENILIEPTTHVNGPSGIEVDASPSFTIALPDDAYFDPREWVEDMPTAYFE